MRTAVLIPCWKSVDLLMISIPSLKKSIGPDDMIIVLLNEADDRSVQYLNEQSVKHIDTSENLGPSAVDLAIPFMNETSFDYVANVNSDMLFSNGWIDELILLLENNYPASASCCLVEPSQNNPITLYDNMGDFFSADHDEFNSRVSSGKYSTSAMMSSYNHPIMCKYSDFISVNGYSDGMDNDWVKNLGKGLDDYFAFRLRKLHNGIFKFIRSNKAFVYHGIGVNTKMTNRYFTPHSGASLFLQRTGMTIKEFEESIL